MLCRDGARRRRWPVTPPAQEIRRRGDRRRLHRVVGLAGVLLVTAVLVLVLLLTRRT